MERGSAEISKMSCSRSEGCAQCAIPGEVGLSLALHKPLWVLGLIHGGRAYSKTNKDLPVQCRAVM